MVNVINAVIEEYGKPDEIRIELARELKIGAAERENMTRSINQGNAENKRIREILEKEFALSYISRNDIIKYKLYEELKSNGFKTLYSDTYISKDKLFSKDFDIEIQDSSRQTPKPAKCFVYEGRNLLYELYFDGGTERKLQIRKINKDNCIVHATWSLIVHEAE